MAARVNTENFAAEVLESKKNVLVDFYTDSCVPCKMLSPVLSEVEEENPDIKIVKVNVNFDVELAEKYQVMTVPALLFFNNGEEKGRIHGSIQKNDIGELIKRSSVL